MPYVAAENAEFCAYKANGPSARVAPPPFNCPSVGRIAIFVDPQRAAIGIFQPSTVLLVGKAASDNHQSLAIPLKSDSRLDGTLEIVKAYRL